MKAKHYIAVCLLVFFTACHSESISRKAEHKSPINEEEILKEKAKEEQKPEANGVLILRTDSSDIAKSKFTVLNEDRTLYTEIRSIDDNEPASDILKDQIRAYYPEYYIVHFDAKSSSDSMYKVKVGSSEKLISKGKYMEFISWPDYILRFFATTTKDNPLRTEPQLSASVIANLDYSELSFRCIEISGDWVKVKCNKDCEGCPNDKEVTGWIRWRENGKVILKQYYTC